MIQKDDQHTGISGWDQYGDVIIDWSRPSLLEIENKLNQNKKEKQGRITKKKKFFDDLMFIDKEKIDNNLKKQLFMDPFITEVQLENDNILDNDRSILDENVHITNKKNIEENDTAIKKEFVDEGRIEKPIESFSTNKIITKQSFAYQTKSRQIIPLSGLSTSNEYFIQQIQLGKLKKSSSLNMTNNNLALSPIKRYTKRDTKNMKFNSLNYSKKNHSDIYDTSNYNLDYSTFNKKNTNISQLHSSVSAKNLFESFTMVGRNTSTINQTNWYKKNKQEKRKNILSIDSYHNKNKNGYSKNEPLKGCLHFIGKHDQNIGSARIHRQIRAWKTKRIQKQKKIYHIRALQDQFDNFTISPSDNEEENDENDEIEYNEIHETIQDETYPTVEIEKHKHFTYNLRHSYTNRKNLKRINKKKIVDSVYSILFHTKRNKTDLKRYHSSVKCHNTNESIPDNECNGSDDNSNTDEEQPNDEFIKKSLEDSIFNSFNIAKFTKITKTFDTNKDYITTSLVDTLINDMRFEDYRTTSARIYIIKAIHRNCKFHRLNISRSLLMATYVRLQSIKSSFENRHYNELNFNDSELSSYLKNDNGHNYTELLCFLIMQIGGPGGLDSIDNPLFSKRNIEIAQNYIKTFINLLKTHCYDPSGTDEEELLECGTKFLIYFPNIKIYEIYLTRIIHAFSRKSASNSQIFFIRLYGKILMTLIYHPQFGELKKFSILFFKILAYHIENKNIQIAKESISFCGSPFVLTQYVAIYPEIYKIISKSLHNNFQNHWSQEIREISEEYFDILLDFA